MSGGSIVGLDDPDGPRRPLAGVARRPGFYLRAVLPALLLPALGTTATAHELTVPGEGEGAESVPVPHTHVCEPFIVKIPVKPGAEGELIVAEVVHRIEVSPGETERYRAMNDAFIAAHPEVVQVSPPTRETNCHGLTFDEGRSWIEDPEPFLRRCTEVSRADARVGDVVTYGKDGLIPHSGRIKEIREEGGERKIVVHSQWGATGDLDHPIDEVLRGEVLEVTHPPGTTPRRLRVPDYGTPTIYRCP